MGGLDHIDWLRVVQVVGFSIGAGFLVNGGVRLLFGEERKRAALLAGIGLTLIIMASSMKLGIVVPNLDSLERVQAEKVLADAGLGTNVILTNVRGVSYNNVIPATQKPKAGERVAPGSIVSFSINWPLATVSEPNGDIVTCIKQGDGFHRFRISGSSIELAERGLTILIWIRPVKPVSGQWYLNHSSRNGLTALMPNGSWEAMAQVGSIEYRPRNGDVVDLAVTVIDKAKADQLPFNRRFVSNMPIGEIVCLKSNLTVILRE